MRFLDEHTIVNGWLHADANGTGLTSDIVSLGKYNHVAVVLDFGAIAGGDADITFTACSDVAAAHTATLNGYSFRKSAASASDDSFAAAVEITDSKIDLVAAGDVIPGTDDGCIVVVEFDASDIRAAGTDFEYTALRVAIGNPGQACAVGCKFVLSEPRYAGATMPSAIID